MDETYTQALERKLAACENDIVAGSASHKTFYEQAYILYKFERYHEALLAINEALQREPEKVSYYSLKSVILMHQRRFEGALAALDKVIQLDPANLAAYINKGYVLFTLQRYDEAFATYQTAQQLDPEDASVAKMLDYLRKVKSHQRLYHINSLSNGIGRMYYGFWLGGIGLALALMALRVSILLTFIITVLTLGALYILASKVYR